MAASKSPHVRLLHINDELDSMLAAFSDMSYEDFSSEIMHVRAVESGFLIISEAIKSLPEEMLTAYPQVEWHAVRGFGNVLRHDYERVDPRRLWSTLRSPAGIAAGRYRVAGDAYAKPVNAPPR